MELRKVRHLSENAKKIKITGQASGPSEHDCVYDCHIQEKEWVGRTYTNMTPCYVDHYIIVADYYNASWTSWF